MLPCCWSASQVAGSASCFIRFVVCSSRLLCAWRVPHLLRIASLGSAAVPVPCRIDCVHLCLAHSPLRSVPRLVFVPHAHDFVAFPARITFSCIAALSILQHNMGAGWVLYFASSVLVFSVLQGGGPLSAVSVGAERAQGGRSSTPFHF